MKVMVTGANGFVGLNIVRALADAGHQIRAFVRATSNTQYLDDFDLETRVGELNDRQTLTNAMHGCDAVIHTAGNTSCYEKDYPQLHEVNVEGTRNVVDAALRADVGRLVYTSTSSTIGARDSRDARSNESTRLSGFRSRSPYARTKRQAEDLVQAANTQGLETIILNLTEVVGPFDHNLQWGRMVLAVNFDQVPFIPPGGASFCSASDVGAVHVNALRLGTPGARYLIGGADHDYQSFLDTISASIGKDYTPPGGSYRWQYAKALLHERCAWLVDASPVVEPYRMRVFAGHYYFDSSKAQNELQYRAGTLDRMVGECVEWYREHGFLA